MILGDFSQVVEASRPVLNPLLSSETGKPFVARNFNGLVFEVVDQLLTRKIHVDNVATGILSTISAVPVKSSTLWSFRSSLVLKAILSNIASSGDAPEIVQRDLLTRFNEEPTTRIPSTPKQSKLAVVGMSCRLPGGANDLDLYWQLLVEGRDAHTTVPPDRFDLSTHFDPTGQVENSTPTPCTGSPL